VITKNEHVNKYQYLKNNMSKSPFKLKSGNTSPFKQMGSSPLKQDYHEAVEHHKKYVASKKMPKSFNIKGDPSTTPGFSETKIGKKLSATGGDKSLEKLKKRRIANTKAGKIIKFGEGSNIIADKGLDSQGRNTWGDKVGKAKKVVKKGAKITKKVVGKAAKFAGGKALGVAGMMMATSSKADQPTKGKGKVKYPGGKIDFTK